jgi:hypothetical protein
MDALSVGEEMYLCDIIGGEPVLEKLDPCKVCVFKSSYSKKIEDADMVIITDYWSPGRITDTYSESLTNKDRKYIEELNDTSYGVGTDEMGNWKESEGWVRTGNNDISNNPDLVNAIFGKGNF